MVNKLYKIAFLDRDGVINSKKINKGYIYKVKDFKWIDGAIETIKYLKSNKYKVIVVTNQSGVARGYFKIEKIYLLNKFIRHTLRKNKTRLDAILFCPFHKKGVIKKYTKNSNLRKPDIGMFNLANKKWKVDKKKSFMIGDRSVDMKFAKNAGIKGYLFKGNNLLKFVQKKIFDKK